MTVNGTMTLGCFSELEQPESSECCVAHTGSYLAAEGNTQRAGEKGTPGQPGLMK